MSTYINQDKAQRFRVDSLECPSFLKEYLNYALVVKNLTPRTVMNYYVQIREFLRWTQCRNKPNITSEEFKEIPIKHIPFSVMTEVMTDDIYEYLTFSATVMDNGAKTRALKLSALKGLFHYYTTEKKRLRHNPVSSVKAPKREKTLPKYLQREECVLLLKVAKEHPVSDFPERDFCMLTFFLNCGFRVSELVGLDYNNVQNDGSVRVFGKGRKERILYLNAACRYALEDYMDQRRAIIGVEKEPALFISRRTRSRLTTRRVEQIIEKMLDAAGMSGQGYSVHKLRHTAATLLHQSGTASVLELQQILGHEQAGTTSIYTHLDQQSIRKVMETSPLAEVEL